MKRLGRAHHAAMVGCALTAAAMVYFATQTHGIALSPDSAGYISTARSVMQGSGVVFYTGDPLVVLAPLYAVVLGAVSGALQADPMMLAPYLNALFLGLSVYGGGRIAFLVLEYPLTALAATAGICLAPTLVFVSVFAWSEALFIFLITFALWASLWYLETRTVKALVVCAALTGLACLTRYAGVPLLGWGIVVILGLSRGSRETRARHVLLFLLIGGLPLGLWALRNYVVSGTLFGGRPSNIMTLRQNVAALAATVRLWFLPRMFVTRGGVMLALGAAVGIWLGAALHRNGDGIRSALDKMASPIVFVVLYVGFLVYSATTTAIDPIGERLLAPVFVPVMLVAFGIMETGVPAWRAMFVPRVVAIAAGLVALVWLVHRADLTMAYVSRVRNDGDQFTSLAWRTSPTVAYVRAGQLPQDCLLMSNDPSALYLLTELVARSSAVRGRYNSPDIVTPDAEQLRGAFPPAERACLIWFDTLNKGIYFTPEELGRIAAMQERARFSDGAIYLVTRK